MEEQDQNLAHIHWSWPEAIAANPARSLATPDLAMDYFAHSPFFDTQSNNSVLRTQRRVENPTYGHAEEKVELTAFRSGFEYVVAHSLPPNLFVIHRRTALPDGGRGPATAAYFILHDKVYQSPSLYDAVSTRLRNATHLLETTFDSLEKNRPSSNPRAAGVWISKPLEVKETDSREARSASATGFGTPGAAGAAAGDKEKEKEKEATDPSLNGQKKEQKGPDWHLWHALNMTTAAMEDLDRMAASDPPQFDSAAEAKALDASAAALVRPQQQAPTSGQSQAPMPQPQIQINTNVQNVQSPMGISAASPFPSAMAGLVGTPGAAPSPLRFRMAADSPAP